MIKILRSDERGKAEHGWLSSQHTFSFADYYNPERMGFRSLRVINEDWIKPGMGFGTHPHRDMEIFSYVVSGELAHKDSMGNVRSIKAGEVQAMSAGSGVTHSEFNPSQDSETHLLQIWIQPAHRGGKPSYAEWRPQAHTAGITLVASANLEEKVLPIKQNARFFVGKLEANKTTELALQAGNGLWIQVVKGQLETLGEQLDAGDAAAIEEVEVVELKAKSDAEFLLFELGAVAD
jgi:redox-sensitive bicupin YhaK (pirin superfamily)